VDTFNKDKNNGGGTDMLCASSHSSSQLHCPLPSA